MNLIDLASLTIAEIRKIWALAGTRDARIPGTVGWSFQGDGIRTRATFIQAFRELGLQFTELPNLLKTAETPRDIAGYLDPLFELYVIRDSSHARLMEFAAASRRPVINAMSGGGHPCEVLTDAYYIHTALKEISSARVCLWGPTTNIFRSWHELAHVFGIEVMHVCEEQLHEPKPHVRFMTSAPRQVDIVITDARRSQPVPCALPLTQEHLIEMGLPTLLPTPPFAVGRELLLDPVSYPKFAGYAQKELLVHVHRAIIRYVMGA